MPAKAMSTSLLITTAEARGPSSSLSSPYKAVPSPLAGEGQGEAKVRVRRGQVDTGDRATREQDTEGRQAVVAEFISALWAGMTPDPTEAAGTLRELSQDPVRHALNKEDIRCSSNMPAEIETMTGLRNPTNSTNSMSYGWSEVDPGGLL